MDKILKAWVVLSAMALQALVVGTAVAEVDVVSWGSQRNDQGDLRERCVLVTAGPQSSHTVALKNDGTVVAWGNNSYGQRNIPAGLTGVTQIAAGDFHTIALKTDRTVVAWGRNDYGQCNMPFGLTSVRQIAAGYSHTVALTTFTDCNTNGQRDSYELGKGWAADTNANGRIDTCDQADGDMDLNGIVDTADIALLLLDFGDCAGCPADFDGNGVVDNADIALLLLNFGPLA